MPDTKKAVSQLLTTAHTTYASIEPVIFAAVRKSISILAILVSMFSATIFDKGLRLNRKTRTIPKKIAKEAY